MEFELDQDWIAASEQMQEAGYCLPDDMDPEEELVF